MIFIVFAAAVMTLAVPVVLALIVASVQAEDRHGELPRQAPNRVARGVRRLTGLRVGQPAKAHLNPTHFMPKQTRRVHPAQSANSPAQVIESPAFTETSVSGDQHE